MAEDNEKIVTEEGIHCISNGKGELRALLRRDPITKKHLMYFVKEGTSEDIADFIKTNSTMDEAIKNNKK